MKVTWYGQADEALETFAFGRKWEANVPQEIDPKATYEIEESHKLEQPDGSYKLRTMTRKVTYIEMMKTNSCFHVEGEPLVVPKKRGRPPKYPNAAEEYGGKTLAIGE
jgi:hypothetical protein